MSAFRSLLFAALVVACGASASTRTAPPKIEPAPAVSPDIGPVAANIAPFVVESVEATLSENPRKTSVVLRYEQGAEAVVGVDENASHVAHFRDSRGGDLGEGAVVSGAVGEGGARVTLWSPRAPQAGATSVVVRAHIVLFMRTRTQVLEAVLPPGGKGALAFAGHPIELTRFDGDPTAPLQSEGTVIEVGLGDMMENVLVDVALLDPNGAKLAIGPRGKSHHVEEGRTRRSRSYGVARSSAPIRVELTLAASQAVAHDLEFRIGFDLHPTVP